MLRRINTTVEIQVCFKHPHEKNTFLTSARLIVWLVNGHRNLAVADSFFSDNFSKAL